MPRNEPLSLPSFARLPIGHRQERVETAGPAAPGKAESSTPFSESLRQRQSRRADRETGRPERSTGEAISRLGSNTHIRKSDRSTEPTHKRDQPRISDASRDVTGAELENGEFQGVPAGNTLLQIATAPSVTSVDFEDTAEVAPPGTADQLAVQTGNAETSVSGTGVMDDVSPASRVPAGISRHLAGKSNSGIATIAVVPKSSEAFAPIDGPTSQTHKQGAVHESGLLKILSHEQSGPSPATAARSEDVAATETQAEAVPELRQSLAAGAVEPASSDQEAPEWNGVDPQDGDVAATPKLLGPAGPTAVDEAPLTDETASPIDLSRRGNNAAGEIAKTVVIPTAKDEETPSTETPEPTDTSETNEPAEKMTSGPAQDETPVGGAAVSGHYLAAGNLDPVHGTNLASEQTVSQRPEMSSHAATGTVKLATELAAESSETSVPEAVRSERNEFAGTGTGGMSSTRSDLEIAKPPAPTATLDLSKPDFHEKLAGYLQRAEGQQQSLKIRLNPRELGMLQIEVGQIDGQTVARLEVESPAAKTLILEQLSLLRESLNQLGLRLDQVEVEVNEQLGQESASEDPRGDASSEQQSDRRESELSPDESEDVPAIPGLQRPKSPGNLVSAAQVDVQV